MRRVRRALKGPLAQRSGARLDGAAMSTTPIGGLFADAAKRNLEMWQRMQEAMMKSAGLLKPKAAAQDDPPPEDD